MHRTNKRQLIAILIISIFFLCFLSFVAGIYALRTGTIRKVYDIFFSFKEIKTNDLLLDNLRYSKIDTINFVTKKKNQNRLIKIRSDKFNSLESISSYGLTWLGERPWIKTQFQINTQEQFLKGKFKLIGMNADHYREASNWSIRCKLQNGDYIYGYQKFNLLNPYSRGFFIDAFYNELFKENGGLIINSKPIITKTIDEFNLQVFEPFFSKEILENQSYRDYMIISPDSVDQRGRKHLRSLHPSGLHNLSVKQKQILNFYEIAFQKNELHDYINVRDYAFLAAVAINTGNSLHHFEGFNINLYVNPVNGELKPFLREVGFVPYELPRIKHYQELKNEFLEKTKLNRKYKNFAEFEYWLDFYSQVIGKINIDKFIKSNNNLMNLYYYCIKYYPWSFAYKKRIRVPINFQKESNINQKNTNSNDIFLINKTLILKDTICDFSRYSKIILTNKTKIYAKNATLIFSHNIIRQGSERILIKGDKSSTIIFQDSKVDLNNIDFWGFSNNVKISNREVTSAITFYNSKIKLSSTTFYDNFSGDDLINFYRSTIHLENIRVVNAKYDGIDIDYSKGIIKNSRIEKCGNDGIDLGGSSINIFNVLIEKCGDKGISVGEKSKSKVLNSKISNSEIGIGLKDESDLICRGITFEKNHLDLAAYEKKGMFSSARLNILSTDLNKISYLIEPNVILVNKNNYHSSIEIKKSMYGKKYGRATVK